MYEYIAIKSQLNCTLHHSISIVSLRRYACFLFDPASLVRFRFNLKLIQYIIFGFFELKMLS